MHSVLDYVIAPELVASPVDGRDPSKIRDWTPRYPLGYIPRELQAIPRYDLKPQRLAEAPEKAPKPGKPRINHRPLHTDQQRTAAQERMATANAKRAAIDAGYQDASKGRLSRGEPCVLDTTRAVARNAERARQRRALDAAYVRPQDGDQEPPKKSGIADRIVAVLADGLPRTGREISAISGDAISSVQYALTILWRAHTCERQEFKPAKTKPAHRYRLASTDAWPDLPAGCMAIPERA